MATLPQYKVGDVIFLTPEPDPGWDSTTMTVFRKRREPATIYAIDSQHFILRNFTNNNWKIGSILGKYDPQGGSPELQYTALLESYEERMKIQRELEAEQEKKDKVVYEKALEGLLMTPEEIEPIVKNLYPDSYEIIEVVQNGFSVVIHFPELQITNNANRKHTLRDYFVKVTVRKSTPPAKFKLSPAYNFITISFTGARTTFTPEEAVYSYNHSHQGLGTGPRWGGFCLGTGEFRASFQNLQTNPIEDQWYLFFAGIRTYLGWESIEGGPYCTLSNLFQHKRRSVSVGGDQLLAELKRHIQKLPKHLWTYDKDIDLNNKSVEFYDFWNQNSSIRKMTTEGQGYSDSEIESYLRSREWYGQSIKFKGKVFTVQIYKEEEKESTEKDPMKIPIEKQIVDFYRNQLVSLSKNYVKNYSYDIRKSSSKVYASVGTF